jgi:hypothetical protein
MRAMAKGISMNSPSSSCFADSARACPRQLGHNAQAVRAPAAR